MPSLKMGIGDISRATFHFLLCFFFYQCDRSLHGEFACCDAVNLHRRPYVRTDLRESLPSHTHVFTSTGIVDSCAPENGSLLRVHGCASQRINLLLPG